MNKIEYQIRAEVPHGLSSISPPEELNLKARQLLFYAHSLFWAISKVSIAANPDYAGQKIKQVDLCNEVENLSDLGHLIIENVYEYVDELERLAEVGNGN